MPREKSAGAIIYRMENKVPYFLLLHYPSGHWEFAKGHIEEGENQEQAALREIEEETGITDLKIIPGFKEYIKYFFRNNYDMVKEDKNKAPWIFKLVVFYLAQTQTEVVKISDEHIGFAWLSYQQVAQMIGIPRAARAVGNALNKNYDPAIPCHRVVKSNGEFGGYNRGIVKKIALLKQEKFL